MLGNEGIYLRLDSLLLQYFGRTDTSRILKHYQYLIFITSMFDKNINLFEYCN